MARPRPSTAPPAKRPTSPAIRPTKKRNVSIADIFNADHVLSWKDSPGESHFVQHTTIPLHRTCASVGTDRLEHFDLATMCRRWHGSSGKNRCFTCCAYWEAKNAGETPDVENYEIVKFWVDFKATEVYSELSNHGKLLHLAKFIAEKPKERKVLSKLGATRLSRGEAGTVLITNEPCCNYYTLMVRDPDKHVGYIMYRDASNKTYARWLDSVCRFENMSIVNKGDVVEAIMALGFLWTQSQKAGPVATIENYGRATLTTKLDGIMELVKTIEDEVATIEVNIAQELAVPHIAAPQPVANAETELENEDSPDSDDGWGAWQSNGMTLPK